MAEEEGRGGSIGASLKQKIGPIPVWGWAVAVGGVIIFIVRRNAASSTSSSTGTGQPIVGTPTTTATLDPTSVALLGQLSSQLQTMANNGLNTSTGTTANPTQPVQTNQGSLPASLVSWLQGQQQVSIQPVGTPPQSGPPYVGNPAGLNNAALAARNAIGDSKIVAYFSQFKLPSWIGLQYVAENYGLPSGTSQQQITQLNGWLNSKGYRDANGNFTAAVSSPTVPPNVAAELAAAYPGA